MNKSKHVHTKDTGYRSLETIPDTTIIPGALPN